MSIRNNILNALSANLANIKTENGFTTDIKEVHIGSYNSVQINKFPTAGIQLGNELKEEEYEDGSELRNLDVYVWCYVQNPITTNVENFYSDFTKMFYCDATILPDFHQTVIQIPEVKIYSIKEKSGTFDINQNTKLCGILLNFSYFCELGNVEGSGYVPVPAPSVLNNYTLTSDFVNATTSLESKINNISLTSINNNLTVNNNSTIFQNHTNVNCLNFTSISSTPTNCLIIDSVETQGELCYIKLKAKYGNLTEVLNDKFVVLYDNNLNSVLTINAICSYDGTNTKMICWGIPSDFASGYVVASDYSYLGGDDYIEIGIYDLLVLNSSYGNITSLFNRQNVIMYNSKKEIYNSYTDEYPKITATFDGTNTILKNEYGSYVLSFWTDEITEGFIVNSDYSSLTGNDYVVVKNLTNVVVDGSLSANSLSANNIFATTTRSTRFWAGDDADYDQLLWLNRLDGQDSVGRITSPDVNTWWDMTASQNGSGNGSAGFRLASNGQFTASVYTDGSDKKLKFAVGSNSYVVGSDVAMTIVPNTHYVGIGTANPTSKLSVSGNISLTGKVIANGLTGFSGTVTAGQTMVFTNGILTSIS